MKNSSKIISLILSFVMVISVFNIMPFTVMAAKIDNTVLGATPDETWPDIHIGETGVFTDDGSVYYRFIPENDTMICFDDGKDEEEPERADLYIYDSNMDQLSCGHGSLICFVQSGATYYLSASFFCTNLRILVTLKKYHNYDSITIGETKTANIGTRGEVAYYQFVPEEDMTVNFSSISDYDTYGCLYDERLNQIAYDDDNNDGFNFKISYSVQAGKTYIFGAKMNRYNATGSFDVSLTAAPEWEYKKYGNGTASLVRYNGHDENVVIPSEVDGYTVTIIGNNAFQGNTDLISVGMPNTIKNMGSYVFEGCSSLKTVILSNSISAISEGTFNRCSELESILLPDSVKTIEGNAFLSCGKLKNINFPYGLEKIGSSAFWFCHQLSDVVLPNSVEEIGSGAFMDCDALKEVTIGYGVIEIASNAFGYFDAPWIPKADLTIKGYTGSVAEQYAIDNDFTFVSLGEAPPKPTISFTPMYSYEYIENVNGYWETDNIEGTDYSYFVYNAPRFNDGDKLSIIYSDGRGTIDYYYSAMQGGFEDENANYISSYDVKISNTYGWKVDAENTFAVTYKNMSTSVPVTLVKPENASLRYIPAQPYVLIENRDGYMWGDHFEYYTPTLAQGDQIVVDYGDETVTYTRKSGRGFWDENGQSIPNYGVSDDQYQTPWTLGSDNYFIVTAVGKTAIVPVTIIEYPVESIEFQLASPIILYENQDGYYIDDNGNRLYVDEIGYYYYDYFGDEREKVYREPTSFIYDQIPLYKDGNKLIIHNKDGSTKTLTQRFVFTDDDHGYFFVDENGYYDSNVSFVTKIGNDNQITVKYLDNTTTIPVSIVQNNIESIEYHPVVPIVYNIDDPKDVYTGAEYGAVLSIFNPQKIRESGSILTAHFKDGTTKRYTMYTTSSVVDGKYNPVVGPRYWTVDEEGSVIGYSSLLFDYDTTDWTAGNTYYITVSYLGKSTKVPVKVIDGNDDTYILGDADGNGDIESVDATFIQRYIAQIPTPYSKEELMRGDVDDSGDLELTDVTAIQYYLCHLKTNYPIGTTVS